MAGATIDHIISVTILIAALLVTMTIYTGMFATAADYDRNRQVANKAVDIMNTICLSPGNPVDWGETNDSVLGFGLQDPEAGGYALSPYSIMRLRTSNDSQLVEYTRTGLFYNNLSAYYRNSILTPVGDCINYSAASELLGINRTYGFSIDITPTLNITISKVLGYGHLALNVEVKGSGLPLSDATLNYFLFHVDTGGGNYPMFRTYSGVVQSDPVGSALIEFPSVDDTDDAYVFMVYARISGLNGVGYYSQDDLSGDHEFLLPLIQDFDNGTILIAHNWDVHDFGSPEPNVFYNATFFVLTSDFQMQEVEIANSTGNLNYGVGFPFVTTQIPTSEIGILFISYRWNNQLGSVILPWGVGTLGVPASFGGSSDPSGYRFVATELRQVTIDGISYQVKVSTWSLRS